MVGVTVKRRQRSKDSSCFFPAVLSSLISLLRDSLFNLSSLSLSLSLSLLPPLLLDALFPPIFSIVLSLSLFPFFSSTLYSLLSYESYLSSLPSLTLFLSPCLVCIYIHRSVDSSCLHLFLSIHLSISPSVYVCIFKISFVFA